MITDIMVNHNTNSNKKYKRMSPKIKGNGK